MGSPVPAPSPSIRASLRRSLLAWWDRGHRDLPWRFPQGEADPYRVWLAEVMLQQTRVETATPYYLRFLDRWPTLEALAAAADGEVLAAWSGLGYYARCRNLLAAARATLERHGAIPSRLDELRALPGFGPYTAGAVASIAFGVRAPAVDGNAARVLSRLFLVEGDQSSPGVKRDLARLATSLLDDARPGDVNQAIMELGARICVPRTPRCTACPLERRCAARREGREGDIPAPRRRPAPLRMVLALLRVERGGRLLLARSPEEGLFPGMWGLPGLVVPADEDGAAFLQREARSRLGLEVEVGGELAVVERLLTHRRLELRVHAGRMLGPPTTGKTQMLFTSEEEASSLPASTAMRRAIEASGGWRTHGSTRGKTSAGSAGRP